MSQGDSPDLLTRLARIDERITELRDLLIVQRTSQDKSSTGEAAKVFDKCEFTVRE